MELHVNMPQVTCKANLLYLFCLRNSNQNNAFPFVQLPVCCVPPVNENILLIYLGRSSFHLTQHKKSGKNIQSNSAKRYATIDHRQEYFTAT